MKTRTNSKYILIGIFLLALIFRLYFAFQTNNFSSDDAYFNIRHADYIKENLNPMYYDELSYGGRHVVYPFLYHYLIALLSFVPVLLKIMPEIFLSAFIFVVYLLAKEITKSESASLASAFMSAFIPIYIYKTLNQLSIYSLVLPATFFMLYCLLKVKSRNYLIYFIILSFILPLLHPLAFLFVLASFFYIILSIAEDVELSKLEKEAIIFSCFLIILIEFIIFKKAFLEYGFNLVWQNIPHQLLPEYFKRINLLEVVYRTGILPIILGSVAVYQGIIEKRKPVLLLSSFILITALLLTASLLDFNTGIMLLSIIAAILSALSISRFFSYFKILRFYRLKKYL